MQNSLAWLAGLALCSMIACGGGSSAGDAATSPLDGAAGDRGAATGGSGGTAGGGGSGGGGSTGGSGGGGSADAGTGSCQACIACAQASCATGVSQCQANTACNSIYQCASQCTATPLVCAAANPAGAVAGQALFTCLNQSCTQECAY